MTDKDELQKAMVMIKNQVLDGLRHGYFKFTVQGECLSGGKRRLKFSAGKSHQYIISETELN